MSLSASCTHLEAAPLRDRLADAMRVERFGQVRPLWPDLEERIRDRWRERADRLLILARNRGISIEVSDA
jgi:hypothetical protein